MIRRLNSTHFALRLVTLLLPCCAFGTAFIIHFFVIANQPSFDLYAYGLLLLYTSLVWSIAVEHFGMCRIEYIFLRGGTVSTALTAVAFTFFSQMVLAFFYRTFSYSRIFIALATVLLFLFAVATRFVARAAANRLRRNGNGAINLLVIGADGFAVQAIRTLAEKYFIPCRVIGFVRLPAQEAAADAAALFEIDQLPNLAVGNGIDDVIIAVQLDQLHQLLPYIMEKIKVLSAPVRAIFDLGQKLPVGERLLNFGGVHMLNLCVDPAESVMYTISKRAFDLVFAAAVIVITSPLMALIALAIRITSPGPILFKQERVGLNGQLFEIYKFRTMAVQQSSQSDTLWTKEGDPRCTRMGSLLRRTSLDELPQFFNVMKGDMSVVGPRPERPFFVQKFLGEVVDYSNRHYLKAGITGWAQVNGWRGNSSIPKRIEYDLYYLRNWSLLFDIRIILLTLFRLNKGAY